MPSYSLTEPAVFAFVAIPVLLVAALTWAAAIAWAGARLRTEHSAAAWRVAAMVAIGSCVWMGAAHVAATSGILREWDRTPPPFALLVAAIVIGAVALAFSTLGGRIATHVPLWALVGVQGFRLPLELAMHRLVGLGIMPEQMSYTGRNLDIVTGATAIIVAALVASGAGGRRLVALWNVLGLGLLLNVVVVAILSTPRFQFFGAEHLNVFVTYPPFVWLPAVMVLAALAGHLLIFRALRRAPPEPRGGPAAWRYNPPSAGREPARHAAQRGPSSRFRLQGALRDV
jgi:hypothetical protein